MPETTRFGKHKPGWLLGGYRQNASLKAKRAGAYYHGYRHA